MGRNTHTSGRLLDDTRGAVMVMGVVFAALLTGILWHLVGVGDAIIYRERMQEAADATAFESAVWHARTMNLLVALNIVMSAILMFLVMWRLFELVMGIAIIVTALLAFIPGMQWMGAVSARATAKLASMQQTDLRLYAWTEKWLIRINKAQKIVSTAAPAINLAEPSVVNSGYYAGPSVNGALALSTSILPSAESIGQRGYFPVRMNMSPWLPAMPVQEEGYWKVCNKAGEFIPRQISEFMRRMDLGSGVGIDQLGANFGKLTGTFPGYFCGSLLAPDGVDGAIKGAATQHCDAEKTEHDRNQDNGPPQPFDYEACKKKAERSARFQKDQVSVKPAKVWDIARNGGVFFQTWSFTHGNPDWSYSDDAGVAIADGGRMGDNGDHWSFHLQAAQAEYYYDAAPGEGWDVCSGDAMWNMKWRARLRRVHDPIDMFDGAALATGYGVNALNRIATEVVNKIVKLDALKRIAPYLRNNLFDNWFSNEWYKKRLLRDNIEGWTYGAGWHHVGMWITGHYAGSKRPKMIH